MYLEVKDVKTTFTIGDSFAFEGKVIAKFDDNSELDVTASAVISGYDLSKEGTQTIRVTYVFNGVAQSTTYEITIKKPGEGETPVGGCGGSIVAGSTLLAITSFLGFGLLITKKKFSK